MKLPVAFQRIKGKWFVDDIAQLEQWQNPEPPMSD